MRAASAIIVCVGFFSLADGNTLPSTTNRFLTSCVWHHWLTTLVRASLDLGAGPVRTFVRIILPLTAPGIAGGAIIVFIPALGNFVVPAVLGGAKVMMLGNLIEQQFLSARNWPFGSALAMMVMSVMLVLLFIHVVASGRRGADATN